MKYRTRTNYTDAQKALMWERWKEVWTLHQIAQRLNRAHTSVQGICPRRRHSATLGTPRNCVGAISAMLAARVSRFSTKFIRLPNSTVSVEPIMRSATWHIGRKVPCRRFRFAGLGTAEKLDESEAGCYNPIRSDDAWRVWGDADRGRAWRD